MKNSSTTAKAKVVAKPVAKKVETKPVAKKPVEKKPVQKPVVKKPVQKKAVEKNVQKEGKYATTKKVDVIAKENFDKIYKYGTDVEKCTDIPPAYLYFANRFFSDLLDATNGKDEKEIFSKDFIKTVVSKSYSKNIGIIAK